MGGAHRHEGMVGPTGGSGACCTWSKAGRARRSGCVSPSRSSPGSTARWRAREPASGPRVKQSVPGAWAARRSGNACAGGEIIGYRMRIGL